MVRQASIIALTLMLLPTAAFAQAGIVGVVRDTTGGVLPGVTVEASSPVLIEQVRSVITDRQGLYRIVDLRPGVYTVTFSLIGFNTFSREGIELTGTFTSTVNGDMAIGELEETITVSGAAPLVDVQSVTQERVITKDVLDAVPSGRTFQNLGAVIPGMTMSGGQRLAAQDVGGSGGDQSQRLQIHGGRRFDQQNTIDGLTNNNPNNVSSTGLFTDMGSMQEMTYELGQAPAEQTTGGVHVHFIPRDGGNTFSGSFFGAFTNRAMQSGNVTDNLRARGLGVGNEIDKIWDLNAGFGGPIKRDRLWFFTSSRYWGLNDRVAGMWHDLVPLDFEYTPDLSRQAIDDSWLGSQSLRLTWQATQSNKISSYLVSQGRCLCHNQVSATRSPEASNVTRSPWGVNYMSLVTWNAVPNSRVLFEVAASFYRQTYSVDPQPEARDLLAITERSTGVNFRSSNRGTVGFRNWTYNYNTALTYVTGSHAFKVGMQLQRGKRDLWRAYNGQVNLQLLRGVPQSVTVYTTPYNIVNNMNAALGLYAQDRWTVKRLTLNVGVRFDSNDSSVPAQHLPAVRWVGARDFAAIPDVPSWTDLSPRVGAAYDLFANGKTALKVSMSRYVAGETIGFANRNNPINTSVNSAKRTWTDHNGDFLPQEEELGALSNRNFGQVVIKTRFDDAIREGFGKRLYNWETSAGIQHELLPQVSVNLSYHRRSFGNFTVTDNLEVTPTDYDPFCITSPSDSRLPGGGGQEICGLYDITPAKFGLSNNFVTFAEGFGKQTEVYNGVDFTIDARIPGGGLLTGGMNTGRLAKSNCFKIDSPEALRFCDVSPPLQAQVKFLGVLPLPWWDLQASGTFQSMPGAEISASYVATNSEIRGSLGRDLARGARGTQVVQLIEPGTMYDERLYQVDLRIGKVFQVGGVRIQTNWDLYNLLNANPVLTLNTRYGSQWMAPTYILPGRIFKFGAQIDF